MVENMRRTVAAVAAGAVAAIAPIGALVTSNANAATPHAHVVKTSSSTLRTWAEGTFRVGHDITIDADGFDAHGVAFDKATVIGPAGIRGQLTPAADAGHLVGDIHIPAHIRASWIRLTIVAPNGATTHLVIHAPAAHTSASLPKHAWSKAWAESAYQPGKAVTIDADGFDAHGMVLDSAKVFGPNGIHGTLTPAADAPHLTGEVVIPKNTTAKVLHLKVQMSDGQRTAVTLQRR